ncbi:MAG: hypothetical protein ACE5F4_02025 [Candidatus Paceibacteria bacterium]
MPPFDLAFILWPFFFLALVAVAFYGFSLLYHWLRFGAMYPLVWIALPLYVVGTVILIGAMLTGIMAVA